MSIQKEKCGCFVARYQGIEVHGTSFCDAITKMLDIVSGKTMNPNDIPL